MIRINKFIAQATGLSRRASDRAIQAGRVNLDGRPAGLGDRVGNGDSVTLDGRSLHTVPTLTIMLNKPPGYVCSRRGQGSATIYELLPTEYRELKPVGRLDKDSSGLLLLTNDGDLAEQLTHPRYAKTKTYEVTLNQPLTPTDQQQISKQGVQLDDGPSRLGLKQINAESTSWQITMQEGRNRQIRRTFAALGYGITSLHRSRFGDYDLEDLAPGELKSLIETSHAGGSSRP